MASKPVNSLDELLKDAEPTNREQNFEKIAELAAKAATMRYEEAERTRVAEKYFKILRFKLDQSGTCLAKAKKDLENINFAFERNRIREQANLEYDQAFLDKPEEEIDEDMAALESRLTSLEIKVKTLNNNTCGAENSLEKSIKTLQNISKGKYLDDIEM